jgi:hypothetical protein
MQIVLPSPRDTLPNHEDSPRYWVVTDKESLRASRQAAAPGILPPAALDRMSECRVAQGCARAATCASLHIVLPSRDIHYVPVTSLRAAAPGFLPPAALERMSECRVAQGCARAATCTSLHIVLPSRDIHYVPVTSLRAAAPGFLPPAALVLPCTSSCPPATYTTSLSRRSGLPALPRHTLRPCR